MTASSFLRRALPPLAMAALLAAGPPLRAQMPEMPDPAAGAGSVLELGYDVYLGGLNVFAFDVAFLRDGEAYVIRGGGESRGLIRVFWRWAADLAARGTVGEAQVDAQIYDIATVRRGEPKSLQLSFDGPGAYSIARDPPDNDYRRSKREPPASLPADTVDPLSVALVVSEAVGRGRGCALSVPVFDGDRRYDLVFTELGRESLEPMSYTVFAGEALSCRFEMKRLSGFRKPRKYVRYWDEDGLEPPRVWVARLAPGLPPVPVRLAGDLNMGGLRIYLVRAEHDGRPIYPRPLRPPLQQARNN